jgi:dipeptidyl aminopeptidase/acylaminoacyl peptidase
MASGVTRSSVGGIDMQWFGRIALLLALTVSGSTRAGPVKDEMIAHPDKSGAQIEYFVRKPAGTGPWPTVIFLHGYQSTFSNPGGRAFVDWGVLDRYAKKGYLAVSVSLPGFGHSAGPQDLAGLYTQHAVQAVLATLVAAHQADLDNVVIEGISLGAITGALIAAHDPDIAGLVLISGLYDLPAFFAHAQSAAALSVKASAVQLTGGSDAALHSRSALFVASNIKADTLILNGAKDDRTDAKQAVRFAAAITAHGGRARAHIFPEFGHAIPFQAREAEIEKFIEATIGVRTRDQRIAPIAQ